jgi:hypothetical protein
VAPFEALADTHYPIIELSPIFSFDTGGDAIPKNGRAGELPPENGSFGSGGINVNGSITLPITKRSHLPTRAILDSAEGIRIADRSGCLPAGPFILAVYATSSKIMN